MFSACDALYMACKDVNVFLWLSVISCVCVCVSRLWWLDHISLWLCQEHVFTAPDGGRARFILSVCPALCRYVSSPRFTITFTSNPDPKWSAPRSSWIMYVCVHRPVMASRQATSGEAAAEDSVGSATRPAEKPERRWSTEQGTHLNAHKHCYGRTTWDLIGVFQQLPHPCADQGQKLYAFSFIYCGKWFNLEYLYVVVEIWIRFFK